jgi:hypothetical protein
VLKSARIGRSFFPHHCHGAGIMIVASWNLNLGGSKDGFHICLDWKVFVDFPSYTKIKQVDPHQRMLEWQGIWQHLPTGGQKLWPKLTATSASSTSRWPSGPDMGRKPCETL